MTRKKVSRIEHIKLIHQIKDSEVDSVYRELNELSKPESSKVIIDISELTQIGRKAVVMLTRLANKVEGRHGTVVLLSPTKEFISVLRETKLTTTCLLSFSFLSALNLLSRV